MTNTNHGHRRSLAGRLQHLIPASENCTAGARGVGHLKAKEFAYIQDMRLRVSICPFISPKGTYRVFPMLAGREAAGPQAGCRNILPRPKWTTKHFSTIPADRTHGFTGTHTVYPADDMANTPHSRRCD